MISHYTSLAIAAVVATMAFISPASAQRAVGYYIDEFIDGVQYGDRELETYEQILINDAWWALQMRIDEVASGGTPDDVVEDGFFATLASTKGTGFFVDEFQRNVQEGFYDLKTYEAYVLNDLIWWTDLRFEQLEGNQGSPASREIWNTDLLWESGRKTASYVTAYLRAVDEGEITISTTGEALAYDTFVVARVWVKWLQGEIEKKDAQIVSMETRLAELETIVYDMQAIGGSGPSN